MLEVSSVYFQCVNERAAHLKIDRVSRCIDLGHCKSLNFSCYWMSFDYRGSMNENQKALGVLG